jgi:hypothetical protein
MPGYEFICTLYIVSAKGGKPRRLPLTARSMSLAWDSSGRHLLVSSADDGHGLRIVDVSTGDMRPAIREWIQLAHTTGPGRLDLQLVRIGTSRGGRISLALITSIGQIKTRIVVPRGWDTEEVAAYVP